MVYSLVVFEDDEGSEFVMICDQDYYVEVEPDIKVMQKVSIEGDFVAFPTNRPLSANF